VVEGWGEGVSPSPFIKIYERGRRDPFTPAYGPLLPRKDLLAGLLVESGRIAVRYVLLKGTRESVPCNIT
jgi:hypothetical protein